MTNLSYLFNVKYYESLPYSNFKGINDVLFSQQYKPAKPAQSGDRLSSLSLRVADYPGLLIGLGYPHDAGGVTDDKDEVTLGISLDYVTGLPYIPGSTVKGVLRSAFKHHSEYVFEDAMPDSLKSSVGGADKLWNNLGIPLFGDEKNPGSAVFFDAFPVETGGKQGGRLLGRENITPHVNRNKPELSGLTEPNPLTLMKVLGGTVFCFKFDLGGLAEKANAEDLLAVFENIFCDLGIGAKTNVGFGGLENCECSATAPLTYTSKKDDVAETCEYPGCTAKKPTKPGGGFHQYCQQHHQVMQKKGGIRP